MEPLQKQSITKSDNKKVDLPICDGTKTSLSATMGMIMIHAYVLMHLLEQELTQISTFSASAKHKDFISKNDDVKLPVLSVLRVGVSSII